VVKSEPAKRSNVWRQRHQLTVNNDANSRADSITTLTLDDRIKISLTSTWLICSPDPATLLLSSQGSAVIYRQPWVHLWRQWFSVRPLLRHWQERWCILDCRRRTDGNPYRVDRPSDQAQLCTERTVTVPTRNLVERRTAVVVLPQVGRCTLSAACVLTRTCESIPIQRRSDQNPVGVVAEEGLSRRRWLKIEAELATC